jgi:hypothetical protein
MPGVLQNLLTNKIVLNIVCVLSALNIIGYLAMGKITAILFFIVLAILITQFNKNMIIVLGVPLILLPKDILLLKVLKQWEETAAQLQVHQVIPMMTQQL